MSDSSLDQILAKRQHETKEIVNVDEPAIKLVICALGNDWFAFNGERIREILTKTIIFFVPGCPPSLEGVINVRGDIESVIRLHELLHIPAPAPVDEHSTILLGHTTIMKSGIRVDTVIDVVDIPQGFIQPPPVNLPEQLRPYVTGLLHFQKKAVTILDLEQIFTHYLQGMG